MFCHLILQPGLKTRPRWSYGLRMLLNLRVRLRRTPLSPFLRSFSYKPSERVITVYSGWAASRMPCTLRGTCRQRRACRVSGMWDRLHIPPGRARTCRMYALDRALVKVEHEWPVDSISKKFRFGDRSLESRSKKILARFHLFSRLSLPQKNKSIHHFVANGCFVIDHDIGIDLFPRTLPRIAWNTWSWSIYSWWSSPLSEIGFFRTSQCRNE